MDRAMRMMLAGGLTLLLSGFGFMIYLAYLHNNPRQAVAGTQPVKGTLTDDPFRIPTFSLVDQDERPRDRSILEGRVSVVWFMFTSCPLACPSMSVQMSDLQKKLKGSGVQFVAFSIDPEHDTPAALKAYGAKYDIDWSNWTYLTESPAKGAPFAQVGRSIYTNDLKQFFEETPNNPVKVAGTDATMANLEHAVNFFVVGPDGTVLNEGWYSSLRPEELEKMRDRLNAALKYFGDKGELKKP
jgi:protein SCO1/2